MSSAQSESTELATTVTAVLRRYGQPRKSSQPNFRFELLFSTSTSASTIGLTWVRERIFGCGCDTNTSFTDRRATSPHRMIALEQASLAATMIPEPPVRTCSPPGTGVLRCEAATVRRVWRSTGPLPIDGPLGTKGGRRCKIYYCKNFVQGRRSDR
jgi:hypothetical protein